MESQKTSLYNLHKRFNGNIIDFHGVLLPVLYSSIQEEHNAVREKVGIFDASHMGNIIVHFPDINTAIEKLNYLLANDFSKIRKGKAIYSTMLKEDGTILDDLIVMCMNENLFHIVVNFTNIKKDFNWISSKISSPTIKVQDMSHFYAIIPVQGPLAKEILKNEFGYQIDNLKSFEVATFSYKNEELIVARTGYTGEDGFELIINNDYAESLFTEILEKGNKYGIKPCGLGARDTLRIEAGLPLYDQELDEEHSPLQTMVYWSVKLNKNSDFIGKKAIIDGKDNRFSDVMIGFEVEGRSIPRTGMELINSNGEKVGYVTSGTFAPFLKKNIGIAFVKKEYKESNELFVKIRNKNEKIKIVNLPFYKRVK
ncbi:MAG TPA: glycine cleavage system aminomethyltransferase GcvT [Spirochaetota bacterium]|nr:glycine cleavage system aminomethyltransferase GcvT [Spirochaetota bacterium]HOL56443.1 glycine cleavage system aminomethyltransferase GcvT [Spirochaetota bacterium]HPP04459.1 glycine cleavage system aminomethyltransferase GcvT [Spirochaetota bacterium]